MIIVSSLKRFHGLTNPRVDLLYWALSIMDFGQSLISVFIPIYLWHLGFPLYQLVFFSYLHFLYALPITRWLIPAFNGFKEKVLMLLSIPFYIIYFYGLSQIDHSKLLFALLPLVSVIGSSLFNNGFHLAFADSTDSDHAGEQVGMRNAVDGLIGLVAPFAGAMLISYFGYKYNFWIAAGVMALAILPLFLLDRKNVKLKLKGGRILKLVNDKRLLYFNLANVGYAVESVAAANIYPLFVYLTLGSITKFGGVISLAFFTSSVATIIVGYYSDHGMQKKIVAVNAILLATLWVARAFVHQPFWMIVWYVLAGIVASILYIPWTAKFYRLAKQIGGMSGFIVSEQYVYNVSRVFIFPIFILLAYVLPTEQFFRACFLLIAPFALLFLFTNKQKLKEV